MANVQFGSTTIDVPDALLKDPQALKKIASQVQFTQDRDETTGADAATRFAVGSASKPEDQLATLQARGYDAARIGEDLYYRDEAGKSRRVNPKGLDIGDLAGAAPEIAETAGSVLGGILGGGTGLATGPGAVATAMAGSAAGAVAGKEGAQWLGRQFFDTEDRRTGLERLADVGKTAALGAVGEGIGQVVGHGVKAARMALTPGAESQAVKATAEAIGLPPALSTVADSRVGRLAEDMAANSRLGRPGMERAVQQQNHALGQELDALTATGDNGWRQAARLHVNPDVVEQSSRVSREIPVDEPLGPVSSGWHDIHNLLIGAGSPEQRRVFARQALQRLGGDAPESFNAGAFLQNWQKADPRMKHALGKVEGVGKELNALLPVVRRTANLQQRTGKALETPAGSIFQLLGIGGGFAAGGALGAGAAALAPAIVGKLLTPPRFVNWLTRIPKDPGAWSKHLAKLATITEGRELYEKLQGQGARAEK